MNKITVSLTQFITFTTKQSGPAKVNAVRKIKYDEYSVATDYWRDLREAIKDFHENEYDLSYLDHIVEKASDRKKAHYAISVRQYKKFIKNKEIHWFDPGKSHWSFNELVVSSTPELGLIINGVPHFIKLYFKEETEKLDKRKASSPLTLMKHSERSIDVPNAVVSMLNIKKSRLFVAGPAESRTEKLLSLQGEAAHFIYLWNEL